MALLTDQSQRVEAAVMADINVTPFTDVLLVLLVVFMILAAMVAPPGFMQRLPNKCGCPHPAPPARSVAVTVGADGRIFIEGRATDAVHIYRDLAGALAAGHATVVAVEAGTKTPYGAIMRVLDAAKADGNARVRLVTT